MYGEEHNVQKYIDYCNAQITELLTQYGPIANIWFDGWSTPMSGPKETLNIPGTYALVRKLQPQCLISYKWGINGEEDFLAPEIHWVQKNTDKMKAAHEQGKPVEICASTTPRWGYETKLDGKHWGVDKIMKTVKFAKEQNSNLLLNIGPRPDGSIPPEDVKNFRAVGTKLQRQA